jgi:hypothetical protein
LTTDPNGAAALAWLLQVKEPKLQLSVAIGIGEARIVDHARLCEEKDELSTAAWLYFDAALLVTSYGDKNKGIEYLNTCWTVIAKAAPRTRDGSLLELDTLFKVISTPFAQHTFHTICPAHAQHTVHTVCPAHIPHHTYTDTQLR